MHQTLNKTQSNLETLNSYANISNGGMIVPDKVFNAAGNLGREKNIDFIVTTNKS